MKNGQAVPEFLETALETDSFALKTFQKMRPSCQMLYADRIRTAKMPEKRLDTVLKNIKDYGMRHNY